MNAVRNFDTLIIRKLALIHATLNDHWKASLYFGDAKVLMETKNLLNADYAFHSPIAYVCYFHILPDQHNLVQASGLWCESLYLGSNV
jgi:hypothetical protein